MTEEILSGFEIEKFVTKLLTTVAEVLPPSLDRVDKKSKESEVL